MESSQIQVAERERLILKRAQDIGRASSELLQVEEIARQICTRTRYGLGYDFVCVQLVDVLERTIQSVYGSQPGGEWYNTASHSLEGDHKFLDIQAYVAVSDPPVIELISGWDDRFDKFIYDKFGHKNFARAFVPLIVLRDAEGRLTRADPEQFGFDPIGDSVNRSIRLTPRYPDPSFQIIGTLEAGFNNSDRNPKQEISLDDARTLFKDCCSYANELCRATLHHVFEVITESAREIAGADISSLHYPRQFPFAPNQRRHTYEVWARPTHLQAFRPRDGGLGELAITTGEPQFLRGSQAGPSQGVKFNPHVYAAGIRSMAAFPLIIDRGQWPFLQQSLRKIGAGVLYVGLRSDRDFSDDEKAGLALFTNLAKDAIRHAIHYAQTIRSAWQLANLHDMATALAHETDTHELLHSIAGHALNVLSADIVIIYEYDNAEKHFLPVPAVGGRCSTVFSGFGPNENHTPPLSLIQSRDKTYAQSAVQVSTLFGTDEHGQRFQQFIEDEGMMAGVAVPLWLGDEVVGLMFVTYRRDREFPQYEDKTIETLASTAAVAIRNRRLLRTREESVIAITHQLRTPLSATAVMASGLREHLNTRVFLTKEDRNLLFNRVDQIAAQLEILDGLCEGVFASLAQEARGGGGGKQPNSTDQNTVDAQKEVMDLWQFLQSTRSAHDLDIEIQYGRSKLPNIQVNRQVFRNVVYSLLDNAMKYADRPSKVTVNWAGLPNGESLLRVSSIGQPISPSEAEKIFWKFGKGSRVGHIGASGDNVGIGLWVARALMRSVGGEMSLEFDRENPRISTFIVRIQG